MYMYLQGYGHWQCCLLVPLTRGVKSTIVLLLHIHIILLVLVSRAQSMKPGISNFKADAQQNSRVSG